MSDERRIFNPGEMAHNILQNVVGHVWSHDAIEDYKKAEFARQMPASWKRLHAIHPALAKHAPLLLLLCALPLAVLAVNNRSAHMSLQDGIILVGALSFGFGALLLFGRFTPARRYAWQQYDVLCYRRIFGALPGPVADIYHTLQERHPQARFDIEVLGDDPILLGTNIVPNDVTRPILVWGPDGKIVLPPQA